MSEKNQTIKIIIASHKKYRMPDDEMYIPVLVGAELKKEQGDSDLCSEYRKDNTGENISAKNLSFCELTGLYWAWKNLTADYIGLVHYRRYFSVQRKPKQDKWDSILTSDQAQKLCAKYDIILPQKRRYYIETLYSHYEHTHYKEHLDTSRHIIAEQCPAYLESFDKVLKQRSGYMFNMYLMKKKLSDEYCTWLFDILFELEKRVDIVELSQFQGRFYGRVSEILLNVWLHQKLLEQPDLKVKVIGCIHMEPVRWKDKTIAFLKAKFLGEKYSRSF